MPSPWYDGTPQFKRQRRLVESPPRELVRQQDRQAEDIPDPEVVFSDLARIANKAKVLAEGAAKQAPAWIDIPEHDTHIRTAVRRKDPTVANGSRITFDLFKDAIEFFEKRREAVKAEDFNDLTGNAISDDQRIRGSFTQSENEDLGAGELGIMLSELMIIWTLHMMMGPWRAMDQSTVVGGKFPPATETPGLISQTLIGLAMQLMIYGLEDRAVKSFLGQSGAYSSGTIDQVIEQARAQKPSRMQELAAKKFGEGDYESILRYSLDYIARTEKTGYEMWLGYYDARRIRQDAMLNWRAAPHYSQKHAMDVNFGTGNSKTNFGYDPAINAAVLDSIVTGNTTYLCNLRDHATRLDHGLNTVAQVLSSHFGQDALCCVGLFLERKDTEWLTRTHQILHIFMMSQRPILQVDFGRLVANLLSIINERIRHELVHLVQKITEKVADPVLAGLEIHTDEDWDKLFACPLVQHLVDMILASVDHLAQVLIDLIPEITFSWEIEFGSPMQDRWFVINTRRKVQALLASLDQVVAALESGLLCAEDGGVYTEDTIRTFTSGVPDMPSIDLTPEEIQEYFGGTQPIEVPRGVPGSVRDIIPKMGESTIRTGLPEDQEGPDTVKRCREVFEAILGSMGG